MIFIFGDLRQLRRFELSRPLISRPQRLKPTHPVDVKSPISPGAPLTRPPLISPSLFGQRQSPPLDVRPRTTSQISSTSYDGSASSCRGSCILEDQIVSADYIHISPAYFDDHPAPEGPATMPHSATNRPQSKSTADNDAGLSTNTASFIHPYDSCTDDEYGPLSRRPLQGLQPITAFDFDALPHRPRPKPPADSQKAPTVVPTPKEQPPAPSLSLSPRGLLLYLQYQCSKFASTETLDPERGGDGDGDAGVGTRIRARFKLVRSVPTFSPFTRVLSPVVARAQWEIVVRSALYAFLLSWIVLACLLPVPINTR